MKRVLLFPVMLLYSISVLSGQTFRIFGRVLEKKADKPVSTASLYLRPDGNQTYTGNLVNYSFTSPARSKQLTARILKYNLVTLKFMLRSDTIIDISLRLSPFEPSEVPVVGDATKTIEMTPSEASWLHLKSYLTYPSYTLL